MFFMRLGVFFKLKFEEICDFFKAIDYTIFGQLFLVYLGLCVLFFFFYGTEKYLDWHWQYYIINYLCNDNFELVTENIDILIDIINSKSNIYIKLLSILAIPSMVVGVVLFAWSIPIIAALGCLVIISLLFEFGKSFYQWTSSNWKQAGRIVNESSRKKCSSNKRRD